MKKLLALWLSLMMLLSLAACGGKTTQQPALPEEPAAQEEAAPAEEAAPEEPVDQETAEETTEEGANVNPDGELLPAEDEPVNDLPVETQIAALHNQDAYASAYLFRPEADGSYVFRSTSPEPNWEDPNYEYEPPVTWTVYALDEEFEDAWRYLGQAYRPVVCDLDGEVTVPLKAGQYVYCLCSVNSFTGDAKADDYASLTISATTAELGPTAANGYFQPVTIGAEALVDLDGDGTEDSVFYSAAQPYESDEGYWVEGKPTDLMVNEAQYLDTDNENNPFDPYDIWMENPDVGYYYIVDLDTSDPYKELVICDWGSNDWLVSCLFRYENGKLNYLGYVTGFPDTEFTTYHGDGTISAYTRFDVMQTWGGTVTYELKDGKIGQRKGEMVAPAGMDDWQITLTQPLTVYTAPDRNSDTLTLQPSSQPLSFPQTDTEHWVEIQCADGTSGWAYFEDFSQVENNGTMVDDSQIFDGLLFAG